MTFIWRKMAPIDYCDSVSTKSSSLATKGKVPPPSLTHLWRRIWPTRIPQKRSGLARKVKRRPPGLPLVCFVWQKIAPIDRCDSDSSQGSSLARKAKRPPSSLTFIWREIGPTNIPQKVRFDEPNHADCDHPKRMIPPPTPTERTTRTGTWKLNKERNDRGNTELLHVPRWELLRSCDPTQC